MKTKELNTSIRKTERQVVDEKLRLANEYLKNADLTLVYEALEKNKTKVNQ